MYYRKINTSYNNGEAQKKIENFNKELHEQYRQRNSISESKETKPVVIANATNTSTTNLLTTDNIIIIGMIILLLMEENKDYMLIGVLTSIIFLNL